MSDNNLGKYKTITAQEFIQLLELKLKIIYFKLQTYSHIDLSVGSLRKDLRFIVDEILSLLPYKKCRMEMETEKRIADIFQVLKTMVHCITEFWDAIILFEFPEKREFLEKCVKSSLYKIQAIRKVS